MLRHFFSILHHLSTVIFANATIMVFLLLHNSMFNFHCHTQCEEMPPQKSAQKWRCDLSQLLARKITKGIYSCKLFQSLFLWQRQRNEANILPDTLWQYFHLSQFNCCCFWKGVCLQRAFTRANCFNVCFFDKDKEKRPTFFVAPAMPASQIVYW